MSNIHPRIFDLRIVRVEAVVKITLQIKLNEFAKFSRLFEKNKI